MGRYYASQVMRDPKLQKKAINYAMYKATPFIQKTGSEMLDQLSNKVRPNIKYKTDRKDLDVLNKTVKNYYGSGVDVHKLIGKLPTPKKGFTLPGHIIH